MDKILYSLGCTCDPYISWQVGMKAFAAPSLFAGLIQLQDETDKFIPQSLFDGTLEENFFSKEKWIRLDHLSISSKNSIFRNPITEEIFSYQFNRQRRTFLNSSSIDLKKAKVVDREVYYNHNLNLLNIHAKDKKPGVDPTFIDYQKAKYEFFLKNKHGFKFGIYLHRSVSEQQLEGFQDLVESQGLDCKNFVVFIRSDKQFNAVRFNKVWLKYGNDEQSNPFYSSQRQAIIDFTKKNFLS